MAKYSDYANLTLDMINSLADDACFLADHFHNEFTRKQFNSIRAERINRSFVKMRTHSLGTLIKYGVIVNTRTEIYHVYVKHDSWNSTTILSDMTDELWDVLPQSIRDELNVEREERKRCYYRVNYEKGEELVDIRILLSTMFFN